MTLTEPGVRAPEGLGLCGSCPLCPDGIPASCGISPFNTSIIGLLWTIQVFNSQPKTDSHLVILSNVSLIYCIKIYLFIV